MKGFHVKEQLYIFFCNMKEIYEFCNVYKLKIFVRLCATLHTIQSLLRKLGIVARCLRQ